MVSLSFAERIAGITEMAAVSCGTSPCQRCKYTTSVDIKKRAYKKLFTHVELHASAVSLLKSGE